eukprot:scaffold793_cov161-Amphora_coffeaeformis.AAC.6
MSKRKATESPTPSEELEEQETRTIRRSPPRRRSDLPRPSYKEDDSEESSSFAHEDEGENEEESNYDGKEDDEESTVHDGKESDKTGKENDDDDGSNKEDATSAAESEGKLPCKKLKTDELECEFCHKKFKNSYGYNYHVDNNVCQKGSVQKTQRGKRKKSEASGKAFPRVRGKQEDRICPHCNKKFTSPLGCQYHVSK